MSKITMAVLPRTALGNDPNDHRDDPDYLNQTTTPDAPGPRLKAVELREFLALEFPPRELILAPWMPTQSLSMIFAWRGVGKTFMSIGIAYAVASGGKFLQWEAPTPRRVLYLDGEMPGGVLQERFAATVAASEHAPAEGFLTVVTPDLQSGAMPDLATAEGQDQIDAIVEASNAELIIVDNLSAWVRGAGRENESESWNPVAGWALKHRQAGRSILFDHHAGKGGEQRGTSKKEDLLDAVLRLKRPPDYQPAEGAVFEVHFDKARNLSGKEVDPFEARLGTDEHGRQCWTTRTLEVSTFDRVVDLANEGLSQKEIAIELDINKSNVSRHFRKAKSDGMITASGGGNEDY